jgi:hypothetical protein
MPPENPNPQTILTEASQDMSNKRYEDALAKHVWFHENALKIQPALYGVRLSFNLAGWHRLGDAWPPALAKLKEIRDATERMVREGNNIRSGFNDIASINQELKEPRGTVDLYEWLDANMPDDALTVFKFAQPALISRERYALAAKYISPADDFEKLRAMFRENIDRAQDPGFGERMKKFAENSFSNGTATLVALLVKSGRQSEAAEIVVKARLEWKSEAFGGLLDEAMKGAVPPPWP